MFGGISIWQLLIVLGIVIVIFGTKRLKSLGSDLGGAVKGFRTAMDEAEKETDKLSNQTEDASFDNTPSENAKNEQSS